MFKRNKICTAVLAALGGSLLVTSLPVLAQGQTVEVTGSRIKRVDAEGALPITAISREELEASGATTVAEYMRTVPFASAGNFRPQSGSSAQSFAAVDLRGLGSSRTLVLIDGRRLPKAPNVGDSVDLNSIPMAAIERVEILTDGASAVYGSDAIAGVVNFITRKDFEGVQFSATATRPQSDGGDKDEVYGLFGMTSDKGRLLGGFSQVRRQMVFTNQRPWGQSLGGSSYGNNYQISNGEGGGTGSILPIKGACNDPNFSEYNGRCRYNFNAVAADEASTNNHAVFLRGEYQITDDWSTYMNTSISKLSSFGRYAPVPGNVTIRADSPNNPTNNLTNPNYVNDGSAPNQDVYLWHRFAAAGNRDTSVDNTVSNALVGFQGRVGDMVDLDFGAAYTKSKYIEQGRGYIVASIAEEKINSGEYDIYAPNANPSQVLQSFTALVGRDGVWDQKEVYGTAAMEFMKLDGGGAQVLVGAEWREENYQDLYDSLSEAGQILGSAGNSAGGTRDVTSLYAEMFLPFTKTLEVQLAGRYEKYSDYGSDFSPKASFRWKAMPTLALRGSIGTGFRAPSLPVLTAKTSFSAESVFDPVSCTVLGTGPDDECQVNTYIQSNSSLSSEQSDQWSFGLVFDPTTWLSLKADYWNIKISDTITYISAQSVVDRDNGTDPRAIPPGLGVTRDPVTGVISRVDAGYANEGTLKTDGIDLNAVTRFNFGQYGTLTQNWTYSYIFSYDVDGTDIIGNVGSPEDRASLGNTWTMGPFSATWNINYIGSQESSPTYKVGAYVTHDLQFSWTPPIKGMTLTAGVLNAGDKMPALVPYDGRNFNFYLYDSYGIQPYLRFTQKF